MGSSFTALGHLLMMLAIPVCFIALIALLVTYWLRWHEYKPVYLAQKALEREQKASSSPKAGASKKSR